MNIELDVLQTADLFVGLEQTQIEQIAALGERKRFHKGEVIMQSGEHGNELCIVLTGQVEIVQESASTAPILVYLGAGQGFGEIAVLDAGPRSATARCASEQAEILIIQGQDLLALCAANCCLGYQLMVNLARDLAYKLRHRNLPACESPEVK